MGNGRLNAVEILSAEQRSFMHGTQPHEKQKTANAKKKTATRKKTARKTAAAAACPDGQVRGTRIMTAQKLAPVARGMALQSVTLRLNPQIARALRRAACERALDYVEPFTQQVIAEAALLRWLSDEGYAIQT